MVVYSGVNSSIFFVVIFLLTVLISQVDVHMLFFNSFINLYEQCMLVM